MDYFLTEEQQMIKEISAKIAVEKIIPAMQAGESSEIYAIASRDLSKAHKAAKELGIEKAFGSYEECLAAFEARPDWPTESRDLYS